MRTYAERPTEYKTYHFCNIPVKRSMNGSCTYIERQTKARNLEFGFSICSLIPRFSRSLENNKFTMSHRLVCAAQTKEDSDGL